LILSAIIVDDEATWPAAVVELLNANLAGLEAFHQERARIDNLCEKDILSRINTPHNPHRCLNDTIIEALNTELADEDLVGWHCTRIRKDEIRVIESDGLAPLSVEFLAKRIDRCEASGEIPAAIANRFRTVNQASESNRSAMIHLIFTRQTLAIESGVIRLFRSWGGEALYGLHESDTETGLILTNIGIPCIVEAVVRVPEVQTYCSVGECFLRAYLHRQGVETGHDPEMGGYVRRAISGDRVRRVIQRQDEDFERLTSSATWLTRLR
jgi:hypothetical protein